MAEMKTRKVLKMESNKASFTDGGKSLERTAPENLNVFFPSFNST